MVSQTSEMEPVYEQYPVKLIEGKSFNDFVDKIPVMGYVGSRTKVLKVVEKIGKEKKEVDPSEFEAKVRAAFVKPEAEAKRDYKAEFEGQKKVNDDLLKRLEALEAKGNSEEITENPLGEELHQEPEKLAGDAANVEPTEKEIRKQLFAQAKDQGKNPAKNISTDDLRKLVE